ncbi:Non-specific serine/threonine protein kinase protein [Dioscorea alata]|uniref:Non-specific serine/threonine protein kinase protein n=1 Tax=Dioscorea alata TaxID=55571 RepID=A0ACB7VNR1_DIOAL|nr:Non-specific serine/threonine protein kinase protein [Dioscorea alata]
MVLRALLLLDLLILFPIEILSKGGLAFILCDKGSNYTTPSAFATNLALLLSNLTASATNSSTLFSTSSVASIYGLAQCRPDLSSSLCSSCFNSSTTAFSTYCPSGSSAAFRSELCLLRYSNTSFFSQVSDDTMYYGKNSTNALDPKVFDQRLADLMGEISPKASQSTSRFSVGTANLSDSEDIYAMLQCTRDLSSSSCGNCLYEVLEAMRTTCSGSIGCHMLAVSCTARYETYRFYSLSVAPPPPAASPPPPAGGENRSSESGGKSRNITTTVLVVVIPLAVAILLFAVCICLRRRSVRTAKIPGDEPELISAESLLFDLCTIREATDNFSDENKLGKGGFGSVYKGMLRDGQEIAVKRLASSSLQGLAEFKNEVLLVAKLQHKNLVRLLGCCIENNEKILVYEYLYNSSLDKFLFDPIKRRQLDWQRRYKIIEDIGRGLLYLHEESRLRIIHRDLKPGNILLDEDMNPKIADFGFAKLFGLDETQGKASLIAGTLGYMAPEYALHGLLSVKLDVYSYGMMVLEIVTGRKNGSFQKSGTATNLLSTVWQYWNEGRGLELKDSSLDEKVINEEVLRCIHIGLLCVQKDPKERPTMALVVLMLSSYSVYLPRPSTPGFLMQRSEISDMLSREMDSTLPENGQANEERYPLRLISLNDLSISEMEGR